MPSVPFADSCSDTAAHWSLTKPELLNQALCKWSWRWEDWGAIQATNCVHAHTSCPYFNRGTTNELLIYKPQSLQVHKRLPPLLRLQFEYFNNYPKSTHHLYAIFSQQKCGERRCLLPLEIHPNQKLRKDLSNAWKILSAILSLQFWLVFVVTRVMSCAISPASSLQELDKTTYQAMSKSEQGGHSYLMALWDVIPFRFLALRLQGSIHCWLQERAATNPVSLPLLSLAPLKTMLENCPTLFWICSHKQATGL